MELNDDEKDSVEKKKNEIQKASVITTSLWMHKCTTYDHGYWWLLTTEAVLSLSVMYPEVFWTELMLYVPEVFWTELGL